MDDTYVFLDLETTGLDGRRDAIIEVALIVWRDGVVVDAWSSLINPQREIPPEITRITGIDGRLVADAPTLAAVRGRIRRLLGDHVLVGHNVDFDLEFLRAEQLAYGNHRLDTLTLASILLPRLGRYDLSYLVHSLNLPPGQAHRAMEDAQHTCDLFWELTKRAAALDLTLLEEIVEAGQKLGWPEARFFERALQARARQAFTDGASRTARGVRLFNPPPVEGKTLTPPEDRKGLRPIDPNVVEQMLRQGSNFSRIFPDYEPRPQQAQMARAVAESLNHGRHLLVEAGTGTGKSLAYLLPAAFWATQNERRVVISTNTINLQDQLIHKDIPALRQALPFEVRVAVRKGKSNYLCARLFQQLRHRGPRDKDEMALLARLLLWLRETETGDVNEIAIRTTGERVAWQRLSGENAPCSPQECAQEKCPLHLARRRAETAHLVIVNHALLLSDVANSNHILPEYQDLIIDEAHHLEDAVTNGLSFAADRAFLDALLEDLTAASGVVGDLRRSVQNSSAEAVARIDELIAPLRAQAQLAKTRAEELFEAVRVFAGDYLHGASEFSQAVRLVDGLRAQPGFDEVRMAWDSLGKPLGQLAKAVGKLGSALVELQTLGGPIENGDELLAALTAAATGLEETRAHLHQIIAEPSPDLITWVEAWRDRISLHAAPLDVGPLVQEHIFGKLETVVLTSATLRTAPQGRYDKANFDYIRSRLNAAEAAELAVGSPFDYKRSTLLYLCSDIPEPRQPGYQRYVEDAIVHTATALGGRTLALFTSYKQLRETARAVQPRLQAHNIQVLAQSEGSSRQILTEQFTLPHARAVLLGARSFWEGFDVPGPGLEAVIVVKLPFDVPSDPIVGARSETFEDAFFEYSIPEAVLRFRQGFGRLIRRKSDEGIVVVLDKRVLTKRYGELFLNALPECIVLRQRTERLPEVILRWQNRARD